MQLSASALLIIQGMTWLAMGVFLLCKGVLMTTLLIAFPQFASLAFAKGSTLVGGHATAVALLISLGMACGWLKARFVLMKVIRKNVQRLLQLRALCSPLGRRI